MGGTETDDAESDLLGEALNGAERDSAVDHTTRKKIRNPDKVVRVGDEKDDLYSDGLELDDATPPMGTDGDGQSH